jgi:hypothetical protein
MNAKIIEALKVLRSEGDEFTSNMVLDLVPDQISSQEVLNALAALKGQHYFTCEKEMGVTSSRFVFQFTTLFDKAYPLNLNLGPRHMPPPVNNITTCPKVDVAKGRVPHVGEAKTLNLMFQNWISTYLTPGMIVTASKVADDYIRAFNIDEKHESYANTRATLASYAYIWLASANALDIVVEIDPYTEITSLELGRLSRFLNKNSSVMRVVKNPYVFSFVGGAPDFNLMVQIPSFEEISRMDESLQLHWALVYAISKVIEDNKVIYASADTLHDYIMTMKGTKWAGLASTSLKVRLCVISSLYGLKPTKVKTEGKAKKTQVYTLTV